MKTSDDVFSVRLLHDLGGNPWGMILTVGVVTGLVYRMAKNYFRKGLESFPGPPIAAITSLYLTYIEAIRQECFIHKLEELHAKYGGSSHSNLG